jgi:hypothetical protein
VLTIAIVLVWSGIAYQILSAVFNKNDDELFDTASIQSKQNHAAAFQYDESVRDPFRYFIPVVKDTTKKRIGVQPLMWFPPPMRLTGIIVNENKRTAIIEEPNGNVWFAKERDTLNGVQIMKIGEKQVTYSFQKRTEFWSIQ